MSSEVIHASRRIASPPEVVFDVLADPTSHAAIDGTGWVARALDTEPVTATGQTFRMGMHHDQHPDKNYDMTNEVTAYDRPLTIAWRPGQPDDAGVLRFGGWLWRYDLVEDDGGTQVTLTYDWSGATTWARQNVAFPPFGSDHLDNSLAHLAGLTTRER